jgi:hypothetical protein
VPAVRSSPRRQTKRAIDAILARREQLMQEVTELRGPEASSAFIANAQQLLTRWWSRASWDAREELLKNVEWLVRVERRRDQREPRAK